MNESFMEAILWSFSYAKKVVGYAKETKLTVPISRLYEKFQRGYSPDKCYGRAWTRIYHRYATKHPLCEMYLKNGWYVAVEKIHYIVSFSEVGTQDESNLMLLYRSFYKKIHRECGDR